MNLEEVLNFRRSVRRYDKNKPIDPEKVKHCLELATLAPNSSTHWSDRSAGTKRMPAAKLQYHLRWRCILTSCRGKP